MKRQVCLWRRRGWVQRGQREMFSLYFGTSCLFSCVHIDCQRWYEVHVSGLLSQVWVRVAYLYRTFSGLSGLWVAGYGFCENIHAGRYCDPRHARLTVRRCTTDGAPADCVEPNHQNQESPKGQCGHYPGKKRVRGRDGVV